MKLLIMRLWFALLTTGITAHRNSTARGTGFSKLPETHASRSFGNTYWAGAVIGPPAPQTSFYSVTGSFAVPNPKPPSTSSSPGTWSGSAWVGIDGLPPDGNVLLQAGIDWEVTKYNDDSISTAYDAWYEWLPAYTQYFSNFAMSAGDIITVLCESTSPTNGKCSLQNHNTGAVVTEIMTAPSTGDFLMGGHADWMVEKIWSSNQGGDGRLPFADFGTIDFFNCQATAQPLNGAAGQSTIYDLSGSEIYTIDSGTSVSTSGQSMSVVYTGNGMTRYSWNNPLGAFAMAFLLMINLST